MSLIALTGASGFIGSEVLREFGRRGLKVRAGYRSSLLCRDAADRWDTFQHGHLETEDRWDQFFDGAAIVVHAAGPSHISASLADVSRDRKAIVQGTLNILRGAAKAGARRVVYLSSAHVYGSSSRPGHRFTENDPLRPHGPYAEAKAEADRLALEEAPRLGIEAIAIRPPMVYGADAPGNFGRLIKLAKLPMPLPLGAAIAKRSFVAVSNLASAIAAAVVFEGKMHAAPFNVTDDHDLSSAEVIRSIRKGLGVRDWQFRVPRRLVDLAAGTIGRREEVCKLFDSYEIDPRRFMSVFGWRPPVAAPAALREAAANWANTSPAA